MHATMLMAAPVFVHVQYVEAAPGDLLLTIPHPTPTVSGWFGYSVATTPTGDLLVGALFDNAGAVDAGVAYLFEGATGALLLTIPNPTPNASDFFGYSVATTPTGNLLVGAPFDDTGAAYLFDGTTGALILTIPNPTPEASTNFGRSVAATPIGDLLVGAPTDDADFDLIGTAYLFDGTTGGLLFTIPNPTPATNDQFGFSVAATPTGDLFVGAYLDDTGALNAGVVHLFEGIPPIDTDNDGIADPFDNCIDAPNPDQTDTDNNGVGDACNDAEDTDGDEWANNLDNCPDDPNPGQENIDGDEFGNACDPFPENPNNELAQALADLEQAQQDLAMCEQELAECREPACIPTHNNEKGPRCSDGIDNDCDGLVDEGDPDCQK